MWSALMKSPRRLLLVNIVKINDSRADKLLKFCESNKGKKLLSKFICRYTTGASEASRKWVGTKIFNLRIFQTELCCHCGMKKWVGTWPISFRFQQKVGGHVPTMPTQLRRPWIVLIFKHTWVMSWVISTTRWGCRGCGFEGQFWSCRYRVWGRRKQHILAILKDLRSLFWGHCYCCCWTCDGGRGAFGVFWLFEAACWGWHFFIGHFQQLLTRLLIFRGCGCQLRLL